MLVPISTVFVNKPSGAESFLQR